MRRLLNMIESGSVDLESLVTHIRSLDDMVAAYDMFMNQESSVLKITINP